MKRLLIIALCLTLVVSCKKRVYHSFTDEERAFLVYNAGEEFKLKNENTGEIISLKVTNRSLIYVEDFGPKLLPSRKEHFMERGEVEFTNGNSLFEGYVYIYKDKIDQFSLDISVLDFIISGRETPTTIEDVTVNGVTYKNVSNFNSYLYISPTHGFIKLEDTANNKHYTRVP